MGDGSDASSDGGKGEGREKRNMIFSPSELMGRLKEDTDSGLVGTTVKPELLIGCGWRSSFVRFDVACEAIISVLG